MYKVLLGQRPSFFSFLSGLMVSMATSAAAQLAFAEKPPANQWNVMASGLLAMVAGVCWFLLSENVDAAARKVDSFAVALKGRDAAIDSLPRRTSMSGLLLFFGACAFTLAWPWPDRISEIAFWIRNGLVSLVS